MRTETINIYTFQELDQATQDKALDNLRDINVDYEWWDSVYYDAERIGLRLTGFELDRKRHATGEFLLSAAEVAQNILNEHGEICETYKTAQQFLDEHNPIFARYFETEDTPLEDELLYLENEFLKDIVEDYSIILQNEYEYLVSDEAVLETINANEYEFTEDGTLH